MPLVIEIGDSLKVNGRQYFEDADVVTAPGGWLKEGTRSEAFYGDAVHGVRALVQLGLSAGLLRGSATTETKTVDVGVFDKNSSEREYSATVYDRIGRIPLPFFEKRVNRALRKAEKKAGELAVSGGPDWPLA